jgi:hypothetical protein
VAGTTCTNRTAVNDSGEQLRPVRKRAVRSGGVWLRKAPGAAGGTRRAVPAGVA